LSVLLLPATKALAVTLDLSEAQFVEVGRKVWQNECGGTVAGLTTWNSGEEFASLGIGHFIWYPSRSGGPFEESWPRLAAFLQTRGVRLPEWLAPPAVCPWRTRAEFLRDAEGTRLRELRGLLAATVHLQTEFLVRRLEAALPGMLERTAASRRVWVETQFRRVLNSGSEGLFALVDYVNFKGEGTRETERYRGEGWGLLQVLERMRGLGLPVSDFALAAREVLTRRVMNSPPARHEARWLPGWKNRVARYRRGS
jgi:hypothetical protein